MNLLKELQPYQEEINAHARGYGMSNKEVAGKLVDLWDKFKNIPEVSKKIYGSVKTIPNTDKGCSGCVSDAIKSIINWKKHLENTGGYKMVPQHSKSRKKINTEPKELKPKVTVKKTGNGNDIEMKVELSDEFKKETIKKLTHEEARKLPVAWGKNLSKEAQIVHLKQQCKDRGIKFHHMAGVPKLTKLLKAL